MKTAEPGFGHPYTKEKQATPQKSLPVKLKRVKIKAFYIITGILDISWHAEKESHHFPLS